AEPTVMSVSFSISITVSLVILDAYCVENALTTPKLVSGLATAMATLVATTETNAGKFVAGAAEPLAAVTVVAGVFLFLVGGLTLLRLRLLAGREVTETGTWDCGFAAPTARMQYTGSSFAQPIAALVGPAIGHERRRPQPFAYFPGPNQGVATRADDVAERRVYGPLVRLAAWLLGRGRCLQSGRVHLYVDRK